MHGLIIAVTETWLTIDNAKDIDIPGYHFEYWCRNDRVGGGVGLFIKDGLVFNVLPITFDGDNVFECIFVEISVANSKNIIVGSVYRPPDTNPVLFNIKLSETLQCLKNVNKNFCCRRL